MAKRGDNIRKRKDGRWEGRYKKGRAADGSIIYGSVYGKTYKEVKEKMASIISHPLQLATPKGQGKTFCEVLNLWMDNNRARLKGGTINKYQNLIDTHIMPELGLTKVNELSATRINTFLDEKISRGRVDGSGGLSASYVRSIMLVINAAIKYAVSEQLCSPLKTPICKPSVDKTELSILSSEEQKKLETSLLNNFDLTGAGIYISLHTGLRIGEVCSLAWNDIDMNKRVIHVRHTVARIRSGNSGGSTILIIDTPKTKASKRDIPISSTLLPILLKLKTLSSKGFLLTGTSEFIKPRTFEYRYHKILDDCGIASVNYHALRHTFATRCVEAGVDMVFSANANYTFEVKCVDKAGNANNGVDYGTSVAPTEFTIDKTKPNVSLTIEGFVKGADKSWAETWATANGDGVRTAIDYNSRWSNSAAKVSATSADDLSGIDYIEYFRTENIVTDITAPEITWSNSTKGLDANRDTFEFEVAPNEKFIVYVHVVDKAGKDIYLSSNGVIVDDKAPGGDQYSPEIDITLPTANANGIYNKDDTVKVDFKVVEPKYSGAETQVDTGIYSGIREIKYVIKAEDVLQLVINGKNCKKVKLI